MKVKNGKKALDKENVDHSKGDIKIKGGMKFDDWQKVCEWREKLEKAQGYRYSSKNTKTAKNVNQLRVDGRKIKEILVYYRIQYLCVKGGKCKPKGDGTRKRKSNRCGCPANFTFLATRDGQYLELQRGFNMQHIHPDSDDENEDHQNPLEVVREEDEKGEGSAQLDTTYEIPNLESPMHASAQVSFDAAADESTPHLELSASFKDLSLSCGQEVDSDGDGGNRTKEVENGKNEGTSKQDITSLPQPIISNLADGVIEDGEIDVDNIVLACETRSKGRPKGTSKKTTVIGCKISTKKPIPFMERTTYQQVKLLLCLMFESAITESILECKYLVQISDLPPVKTIPDSFMDEEVCVEILRDFFNPEAYALFETRVNEKKEKGAYHCRMCKKTVGKNSVQCDGCRLWIHFKCCDFDRKKTDDPWYCQSCRSGTD